MIVVALPLEEVVAAGVDPRLVAEVLRVVAVVVVAVLHPAVEILVMVIQKMMLLAKMVVVHQLNPYRLDLPHRVVVVQTGNVGNGALV